MTPESFWLLVVLCGLATFLWRALGASFAAKIDSSGPLFEWITCVSYAMVAGLVCRMIVFPANDLAIAPLWIRIIALCAGLAAYFLFKKSLLRGVLVGAGTIATFTYWTTF